MSHSTRESAKALAVLPLNAAENADKLGHTCCCWEHEATQTLRKTVWQLLKKPNMQSPYNPAIALLGIYPRGKKKNLYLHTKKLYIKFLFIIIPKVVGHN